MNWILIVLAYFLVGTLVSGGLLRLRHKYIPATVRAKGVSDDTFAGMALLLWPLALAIAAYATLIVIAAAIGGRKS